MLVPVDPVETDPALPRGVNAAPPEVVAASQRARILTSMKLLAARDGYPAVTIAAIVREAGVAKPTFYERFEDKEDCFLQLFDEIFNGIITKVAAALPPGADTLERIELGLATLLELLAADEAATRNFLIESLRAGDAAAARLGAAHETFASVYRQSREEVRAARPELAPISKTRALAIVGAINEPVTAAVRAGHCAELTDLYEELRAVVHALAFAELLGGGEA